MGESGFTFRPVAGFCVARPPEGLQVRFDRSSGLCQLRGIDLCGQPFKRRTDAVEAGGAAAGIPWWLWPNVLALDAPVIAVAWQELFARGFGVTLEIAPRLALFCAVWAVYLADRWLDSRGSDDRQARHLFPRRHPFVIGFLALTATAGGVLCAFSLPAGTLFPGAVLGGIVGAYFVWNVRMPGGRKVRLKEIVVSLVFAVGSALAPAASGASASGGFAFSVALFAILCFVNSTSIDEIQKGVTGSSLPLAVISVCAAVLAVVGALLLVVPVSVGVALIVTGILLSGTSVVGRRFGPRFAGVYADIALCSPVLGLF